MIKKITSTSLDYYCFEVEPFSNIPHGFFTRNGGASPAPWATLNLSTSGGDTRENVVENRRRIFECINRPVESVLDTWQVHSTKILESNKPRGLLNDPIKADGIITNSSKVTLFMRFADCVPILFYDPVKRVVAIAHAGWKGTVNGIASKMIRKMQKSHGSKPEDIAVGIGPCICSQHYLIRNDVLEEVKIHFPNEWETIISNEEAAIHFDLVTANKILLEKEGLSQIYLSDQCTACNTNEWFSHRAEHGATGRFGTFIALG